MTDITVLHGTIASASQKGKSPFYNGDLNASYAHFIEIGRKKGLDISLASPGDYNSHHVSLAWTYQDGVWNFRENVEVSLIYDRFGSLDNPLAREIREKIAIDVVICINHPDLELLCKDKLRTFQTFPQWVIPTIDAGEFDENGECPDLKKLSDAIKTLEITDDHEPSYIVCKPRFGKESTGIYRIHETTDPNLLPKLSGFYIAQPYMESSYGIPELGIEHRHDLRAVIVNGTIASVEIRKLQNKFQSGGGEMFFPKIRGQYDDAETSAVSSDKLSQKFSSVVAAIDHHLSHYLQRIYSIDMAVGKSGRVWVYELNSHPRQTWSLQDKPEVIKARQNQQEAIVDALADFCGES